MKYVLSLVFVALFASRAVACPPVIIDQPVQVSSFGHVQSFAQQQVVVQHVPVQTFSTIQTFAVQPVFAQEVAIVRQRNVCSSGVCGANVNVRVLGNRGRSVQRSRSVIRSR